MIRAIVPALAAIAVSLNALILGGNQLKFIATALSETATVGQFAIAYLYVAWLASRIIADEARDATLDLVTLANTSHREFLASKFLSVWLQAALLLASLIPIRIFAVILDENTADPIFAGFFRNAFGAAITCAIALLFSTLFKRAGVAFVITLLALVLGRNGLTRIFDWLPAQAQWWWSSSAVASVLQILLLTLIAALAVAATLAILRRPDFDLLSHLRRRPRRIRPIPVKTRACVARIVQIEGAGIATFAQSWWGRVLAAALLAWLAYGLHAPSTTIVLGMLVGAEAFVGGASLRRLGVYADLTLTGAESKTLARGFLRGQFTKSLVFLPAIVVATNIPALHQQSVSLSATPLLAILDPILAAEWFLVTIVGVSYAVLLTLLFTTVGIRYGITGITPGRTALYLFGMFILLSLLTEMIHAGYHGFASLATGGRPLPPAPITSESLGELIAALVILPPLIGTHANRLDNLFAHPPTDNQSLTRP